MKEGIYVATYGHPSSHDGRGYAVMRGGRIYCTNSFQAFSGSYTVGGDRLIGTMRLVHQSGTEPRRDNIVVNFEGKAEGLTIAVSAQARDNEGLPFDAVMTWVAP